MATEFVEGETLRQRLKRAPLNLRETLDIAIQIGSALSTAHNAGIVHRTCDINAYYHTRAPRGCCNLSMF